MVSFKVTNIHYFRDLYNKACSKVIYEHGLDLVWEPHGLKAKIKKSRGSKRYFTAHYYLIGIWAPFMCLRGYNMVKGQRSKVLGNLAITEKDL